MKNEKRMSGFVKKLTAALLALAVVFAALPFLPASMEAEAATTITSVVLAADTTLPSAGSEVFYPGIYAVNGSESLVSLIDLEKSSAGWFYINNTSGELDYYENSTFKSGYVYNLYVELAAKSSAKFSDSCSVILATPYGNVAGYVYDTFEGGLIIGFDFYFNLQTNVKKITSVNFKTTSPDPKTGNTVFTPVLNSVNGSTSSKTLVSDVECQWGCRTINTNADFETCTSNTFEPGNEYILIVGVGATGTSAFDSKCKVTLTTANGTYDGELAVIGDAAIGAVFYFETAPTELKITKQPVSTSVYSGEEVSATVEAEGDGVTYQWYVKEPGASAYSKSSVTTGTYTTNMTAAKDGRILQCVIRDRYGNMIKSDVVKITMIPATELKITKQPVSTTVFKGDTAEVSVEAQGDGLTYQWWIKNPGDSAYSKSSITTATYATNMTEAKDGRILRCVVKDRYGNLVRSDIVTINMKAATELKITKQPVSASVLKGETVKVSLEAQGDGLTYQWWIKNPGDSAYSKSSITTATYATNMTEAKDGRILRCVVKDRYGNLVRSDIVTISMKAPAELKITKQPVSASAEIGKYVSVSVEAEGDGLTYQWWIKNPGDSAYTKSSIKTATYTTNMTAAKDGRILRCVIKDKYGNLVRSDIVTINVK